MAKQKSAHGALITWLASATTRHFTDTIGLSSAALCHTAKQLEIELRIMNNITPQQPVPNGVIYT